MREVKPREMPNGSVQYPNPPARVLLMLFPLAIIIGSAVGIPLFLRVYEPIAILYCGLPLTLLVSGAMFYQVFRKVAHGITIGRDYVIMDFTFKKRRLTVSEVRSITLDPAVLSDSLTYRYWGELDSIMTIEFKSGEKLVMSLIPNGVKLRMARVLDPEQYPPAE
jgi:hypothetical protein